MSSAPARLAAIFYFAAALAATDAGELLARADAPKRAFTEGVIALHVAVLEHGKPPIEGLLDLYVQGKDSSVCVFREGKQKGRKILTLGDRVWLIVPGAGKPIPVSKSQRLMGAASFGDIARLRFADEFTAIARPDGDAVVLDLSAKRSGAPYPKGVLSVGRDDGLPRRLRLSLASGKDAKEVRFLGYDSESRLKSMEIRDLLAAGGDNRTTLDFTRYEKRTLDPAIFTPEGARALP